jgi:hypothetical protein
MNCGAELASSSTCQKCGSELVEGAEFCSSCGEPVSKKQKAKKQRSSAEKRPGAMQRLREKYNLPINPVWIIIIFVVILLVILLLFMIFNVPKACRPLTDAIEGSEYNYGCNEEFCVFWWEKSDLTPGFKMKYRWDGEEAGQCECGADPEDPSILVCTFPLGSSDGGVLLTIGDDECENTSFRYYEKDAVAEMIVNSNQQMEDRGNTFSEDVNNAVQQNKVVFEYDPLMFLIQLGGLEQYEDIAVRYEWESGKSGEEYCELKGDGQYYCLIPSESTESGLDVWAKFYQYEQHLQTIDASEIDWSMNDICSSDFVEAMRLVNNEMTYVCTLDYCAIWVSGISAFEDAGMVYSLDGSQEKYAPSEREWDDTSFPGETNLACAIPFTETPDSISVYVDLNGCRFYVVTISREEIQESQARVDALEGN